MQVLPVALERREVRGSVVLQDPVDGRVNRAKWADEGHPERQESPDPQATQVTTTLFIIEIWG